MNFSHKYLTVCAINLSRRVRQKTSSWEFKRINNQILIYLSVRLNLIKMFFLIKNSFLKILKINKMVYNQNQKVTFFILKTNWNFQFNFSFSLICLLMFFLLPKLAMRCTTGSKCKTKQKEIEIWKNLLMNSKKMFYNGRWK